MTVASTTKRKRARATRRPGIEKVPSGIAGLDEITGGGLPRGRTTLVCGGAGCGKTLFGMEFLVNGAREHGEPGVFLAFEETAEEIAENVASLGFDIAGPDRAASCSSSTSSRSIAARSRRRASTTSRACSSGSRHAIDSVKAKRVVLDTLEALFAGFDERGAAALRAAAAVPLAQGPGRHVRDHRRAGRGHADAPRARGVRLGLRDLARQPRRRPGVDAPDADRQVPRLGARRERVSVPDRRAAASRCCRSRASASTTRSRPSACRPASRRSTTCSMAAATSAARASWSRAPPAPARAASRRCSPTRAAGARSARCTSRSRSPSAQVCRNMRSIGLDLDGWVKKGLLKIQAARPTVFGLEMHLVTIHKLIEEFEPRAVVIDPISSLITAGNAERGEVDARAAVRLPQDEADHVPRHARSPTSRGFEETEVGISSLIDTWFQVRDIEIAGERTRGLYLVKSRGMGHSNQVREFLITSHGVDLIPVAVGPERRAHRIRARSTRRPSSGLRRSRGSRRSSASSARCCARASCSTTRSSRCAPSSPPRKKSSVSLVAELHERERRLDESRAKLAEGRAWHAARKGGRDELEPTIHEHAVRGSADVRSSVTRRLRGSRAASTCCGSTSPARRRRACRPSRTSRRSARPTSRAAIGSRSSTCSQNPALARGDQILALPAVVRQLPPPVKKIIGDFSNAERVLVGLDLRPLKKPRSA